MRILQRDCHNITEYPEMEYLIFAETPGEKQETGGINHVEIRKIVPVAGWVSYARSMNRIKGQYSDMAETAGILAIMVHKRQEKLLRMSYVPLRNAKKVYLCGKQGRHGQRRTKLVQKLPERRSY